MSLDGKRPCLYRKGRGKSNKNKVQINENKTIKEAEK